MESVADDLGVPYVRLPALQRELSLRADARAMRAAAPADSRTATRRRAHAHRPRPALPDASRPRPLGGARPRAVVHEYHGHVLSGYFDSRRERVFRLVERGLAHITDRLIAVSDEVRDDLVGYGVAPAGEVRRGALRLRPRRDERRPHRARESAPATRSAPGRTRS